MQEKQIFKPFAEFEEGEFDKMFGFSAKGFDFGVYTFLPAFVWKGITTYHIVRMHGKISFGKSGFYYKVLERDFAEGGLSTNCLRCAQFCKPASKLLENESPQFTDIESPYEALRAHLIKTLKEIRGLVADTAKLAEMPFEEYLQLPKNQDLLKIRFRSVIDPKISFEAFASLPEQKKRMKDEQKKLVWAIKHYTEPLAAAAEQFPNA
jgi:hypothetical protein